MAGGKNVVGQFKDEVVETTREIATDVKDSVGEAIEQGAQSVTGTQLTPQQIQQKQQDEQKQIAETRRKIAFYRQTDQEQKMVRQQNKQKEMQRIQTQQQEKQEEKIEEIQIKQAKKPGMSEAVLRSQAEYKPGKGVGG